MKTKVNLNTNEEINISDLNDSHLIGMEYTGHGGNRGHIRKVHSSLYVCLKTRRRIERNDSYSAWTTGSSIQDLILKFKQLWGLKDVYVFDTPRELKKWLKI